MQILRFTKVTTLIFKPANKFRRLCLGINKVLCVFCWAFSAAGAKFTMPPPGNNMVGALQVITVANPNTTLLDIARRFDLGYHEIIGANPAVSAWTPKLGTKVIVPTQFILPLGPYKGIVVNIPQRRLFYFLPQSDEEPAKVVTFPISISREGWKTPLGKTRIINKRRDPDWKVPKSIREERVKEGEPDFPEYFPPGPDNPMGMLALQTGFSMIFIHGTNRPWGVGMRTSHGCLHLYPEDAAYLFPIVPIGTPVRIINQPYTVGVQDNVLYMSASEPVGEYPNKLSSHDRAVRALTSYENKKTKQEPTQLNIDWDRVDTIVKTNPYHPVPITKDAPALEQIADAITPVAYNDEPYDSSANNAMPPSVELDCTEFCIILKRAYFLKMD